MPCCLDVGAYFGIQIARKGREKGRRQGADSEPRKNEEGEARVSRHMICEQGGGTMAPIRALGRAGQADAAACGWRDGVVGERTAGSRGAQVEGVASGRFPTE